MTGDGKKTKNEKKANFIRRMGGVSDLMEVVDSNKVKQLPSEA